MLIALETPVTNQNLLEKEVRKTE
uniref:Uncharacterized protein n=1 Tax=Anguilla anguilla TaxID=7936 RepID=A0A0E9TE74_ANGAN